MDSYYISRVCFGMSIPLWRYSRQLSMPFSACSIASLARVKARPDSYFDSNRLKMTVKTGGSLGFLICIAIVSQPLIPLLHRVLLHAWKYMRIGVQCHADPTMAQDFLHHLSRDTHTE